MSIIVFHGTKGSPEGNWFPWLKAQFPKVLVPNLPTPEGQTRDNWIKYIPPFFTDSVMIGHSCGATFLLHALERVRTPVEKSIFVSPVMGAIDDAEYDELNKSFYDYDFDWQKIKANAGQVHILHGDNDPYVPMSHAQKLHAAIGGDLHIIPGGGHLNAEAGYTEFPLLLDYLRLSTDT